MPEVPMLMRVAAKALIMNDEGRVLILREAKTYDEGTNIGRYGTPGGRINLGEHFYDALAREVDEETGLTVEVVKPIHVGEWFPVIKDVPNHIVGMFFLCKPISTDIRLSLEHDDFKWIKPEEASEYKLISSDAKAIGALAKVL